MEGRERPRSPWSSAKESVRLENDPTFDRAIDDFYEILKGEENISGTFEVDRARGTIQDRPMNLISSIILPVVRRLSSASPGVFTAEDVRQAGLLISRRHPDIFFDFEENREQGTFIYNARWGSGNKNPNSPWVMKKE